MGRPREHDDKTAAALLDAAERTIAEDGLDALALREVARAAGTTTRAVYSLFGSKDGLLVALGVRAFNLLQREIEALPATDQPRTDLVEVALIFRRFALEHPALFSIAFHRADPAIWPRFRTAATDALAVLDKRFEPLAGRRPARRPQHLRGINTVPGPGRGRGLDRAPRQPTAAQPRTLLAQRLPRPHHRLRRSPSPPTATHEPHAPSGIRGPPTRSFELGRSSSDPSGRIGTRCFLRPRAPQLLRLGLASALGHRLGEVREQHRDGPPEPNEIR